MPVPSMLSADCGVPATQPSASRRRRRAALRSAPAALFPSHGGVGAPDWRARAAAVQAAFVARRLSPGGCADLFAMTLFVDALESRVALRSAMGRWPAS